MRPTISRRHGSAVLLAAWLAQNSAVLGQTPEQQKMWDEQRTQLQAQEKLKAEQLAKDREARRADPMAWVRTLDPMTSGGWLFREVGTDGSSATFSTEHQVKRSGHFVTEWLRQEYAEPHRSPAGDVYLSDVEKVQYDCAKERARVLLVIYYADNNLGGAQQTEEADPKQADWEPIVPGTRSEYIFHWTCGAGSTGARPR